MRSSDVQSVYRLMTQPSRARLYTPVLHRIIQRNMLSTVDFVGRPVGGARQKSISSLAKMGSTGNRGAGGGTRTPTGVSPGDFESPSSADSDTPARVCREYPSICAWSAQGRELWFGSVGPRAAVVAFAFAVAVPPVVTAAFGARIWYRPPVLGERLRRYRDHNHGREDPARLDESTPGYVCFPCLFRTSLGLFAAHNQFPPPRKSH